MNWREALFGKPRDETPVPDEPRSVVDIEEVVPHGADLLYVRGTVDGIPAKAYVPRSAISGIREARRRSFLASYLRGTVNREARDREALLRIQLLGREERVW